MSITYKLIKYLLQTILFFSFLFFQNFQFVSIFFFNFLFRNLIGHRHFSWYLFYKYHRALPAMCVGICFDSPTRAVADIRTRALHIVQEKLGYVCAIRNPLFRCFQIECTHRQSAQSKIIGVLCKWFPILKTKVIEKTGKKSVYDSLLFIISSTDICYLSEFIQIRWTLPIQYNWFFLSYITETKTSLFNFDW